MTRKMKFTGWSLAAGLLVSAVLAGVLMEDGVDFLKTNRKSPLAAGGTTATIIQGEASSQPTPDGAVVEASQPIAMVKMPVVGIDPTLARNVSAPVRSESASEPTPNRAQVAAEIHAAVEKKLAVRYGTADAAEKPPTQRPWSLAVSTTTSFKPQYTEANGPGRGYSATASGRYSLSPKVAVSIVIPVQATDGDAAEVAVADPSVTAALPALARLGKKGPTINAAMTVAPGVSKASAAQAKRGAIAASARASQSFGRLSFGLGASASKSFHRWTFSSLGVPNTDHVLTGSTNIGLGLTNSLSAAASLSYSRIHRYAGPVAYVFANSVAMALDAGKGLSFSAGLSNGGSQLEPDGTPTNSFELYEQDETTAFIGATYAL